MTREEIEAEAYRRFPIDSTGFEMMQRSDVMWDGFVEGAEWMQEQMIEKACKFLCDTCHASYANDCKNKPCELKTGLIETMKGK